MNPRDLIPMLTGFMIGAHALNGCASTEARRDDGTADREVVHQRQGTTEDSTRAPETPPGEGTAEHHAVPYTPAVTGMYTVQIGAYHDRDGAERIAAIAGERLGSSSVYLLEDPGRQMFRICVGRFHTKEEAREFRDDLIRRFPGEYRDAWINAFPQE